MHGTFPGATKLQMAWLAKLTWNSIEWKMGK